LTLIHSRHAEKDFYDHNTEDVIILGMPLVLKLVPISSHNNPTLNLCFLRVRLNNAFWWRL
jgi:hypothetical protein